MCNEEITIRIEEVKPVEIGVKLDIAYAEDPTLVSRLDELNGEVIGVTSSAKIAAAIDSKEAIADAVNGKGGNITADTPLDEYATEIQALTVPVVGKPSDGPRVRFFDYDGTLLKTQYVPKGGSATAPEIPQHERLLFQEWNNDFDNIMHDLDIGAIYTTKSGNTEFDLWLTEQSKKDKTISFSFWITEGPLTIDWGDGSVDTFTKTGSNNTTHLYPEYGQYMMSVSCRLWVPINFGTDRTVTAVRTAIAATVGVNHYLANLQCCRTISLCNGAMVTGQGMFSTCRLLIHLNLPRSFTTIESGAFGDCLSLQSISLGQVTSIASGCFSSLHNLQEMVVPPTVTGSLDGFCKTCRSLTQVTMSAITSLQNYTLQGCYAVNALVLPDTLSLIGTNVFYDTIMSRIEIKATTPPVLEWTFNTGGYLKEIIVPKGCAEAYKTATNWSTYADIIKEMEE